MSICSISLQQIVSKCLLGVEGYAATCSKNYRPPVKTGLRFGLRCESEGLVPDIPKKSKDIKLHAISDKKNAVNDNQQVLATLIRVLRKEALSANISSGIRQTVLDANTVLPDEQFFTWMSLPKLYSFVRRCKLSERCSSIIRNTYFVRKIRNKVNWLGCICTPDKHRSVFHFHFPFIHSLSNFRPTV